MAKNKKDEVKALDVVGSLRKISRELSDVRPDTDPNEFLDRVEAAAWLIGYIADGLEKEFQHAANRAEKIMNSSVAELTKELGTGE